MNAEIHATRVRIDMMRQYSIDELNTVLGDSDRGFLALEQGAQSGKFHLQGVVWTQRKDDTIRERIKRYLGPFDSSTNYSVSRSFNVLESGPERSVERYAQYCTKGFTARGLGDHRIYWSKNIPEERFVELNKAFWDLNAQIKLSQKQNKADKRSIIETLKQVVDTEVLYQPKSMARFIVQYCSSNDMRIPHTTKIQEYVNTLLVYQAEMHAASIDHEANPEAYEMALGYWNLLITKIAELGTPHFTVAQITEIHTARQLVEHQVKSV